MFRRLALAAGLMVLLATASFGVGLSIWSRRQGPHRAGSTILHWSPVADSATSAARLAQTGLISSPRLMQLYLLTLGRSPAFVAGEHLVPAEVSPRELVQLLARLPTRPGVRVSIPEGFDHFQVAARLQAHGICSRGSFLAAFGDPQLLGRLGITGPDAEGYLFPATYTLKLDSDPKQLLVRFVEQARKRLRRVAEQIGPKALADLETYRGWGEHEILTLASMVEKETAADDERALVASVFFNRLDDPNFRPLGMLQSDPTAHYGCLVLADQIPSCAGAPARVTPAMLRDSANPYNTYRHAGLPPGPIANPGEASLRAVLEPAKTEYLFFVARGGGRHRFSRSFEEHDRAVQQTFGTPPAKAAN